MMLMLSAWEVDDLPKRLAKRVTIDPRTGCWRVGGYHDDDGYTAYAGEMAHRAAYKHLVGPIPADKPQLDHVKAWGCIWRDCIWPAHLEPVTPRENTMRGCSFAVTNAAKTHCSTCRMPYDDANTYYGPDGRRHCRNCNRAAVNRYAARQRAKQADTTTLPLAA